MAIRQRWRAGSNQIDTIRDVKSWKTSDVKATLNLLLLLLSDAAVVVDEM